MAFVSRGLRISSFHSSVSKQPIKSHSTFSSKLTIPTLQRKSFSISKPLKFAAKETPPKAPPKNTTEIEYTRPTLQEEKKIILQLSSRYGGGVAKKSTTLFTVAVHNNILEKIQKDAQYLLELFRVHPRAKAILQDPNLDRSKVLEILQEDGDLHVVTVGFLASLEQKFLYKLPFVLRTFIDFAKEYKKESAVHLILAKPVETPQDQKYVDSIVRDLKEEIGFPDETKFIVSIEVDKSILSGYKATVDQYTADRSMKTALDNRDKQVYEWIASFESWDDPNKADVPPEVSTDKKIWTKQMEYVKKKVGSTSQ